MMKKLTFLFLILFNSFFSHAQEGYPKPTVKDILFYIQHSRGKNTFIYQPNYSATNKLNDNEPIKTSRQLFDRNGEIKPLTNIQRRYAYGVKTEKLGNNHFQIELVSYPGQKLHLKLDKQNKPYVEGIISGQYMHINRLFIKLKDGTSGLQTEAEYILFYGTDKNGKPVHAKMTP
ncbi:MULTISPECIES: DUF4833 domain-containing protein [Sphingobacterium]|uniref:DUF4833 domain-containing protein n=1 Tax=Sphingobacterium litopenaei TaxID=2763500 RepID=A0ABR7YIE0_9SPHI|nr:MULTISPECIES: DUF4833 domain-containing protein [Sphingobacterium]MBD1431026.1 DUF4833 domain-containing protein [Sphingobacterium litopenaei]NGM74355.1 DUF4833 domain-containing protein [Sphingobacterium sp. SGL-16]